jgi:glyoxalase-like protein
MRHSIRRPGRCAVLLLLASACIAGSSGAQPPVPPVRLDHVWIAAPPGAAAERAALERIGFRIAPAINRHVGQGTASATVELENGFLELIWPDDEVPVSGGGARGKERFVERMNWRTNGVSPFGIALARTPATPARFPFETWEVGAEWMEPGTAMVMLTPRGSRATNIAVHPNGTDEAANRRAIEAGGEAAAMFLHPNGARRLTAVRVTSAGADGLPASAGYVEQAGAAEFRAGTEWLMEVTLDDGRAGQQRDLRPTLPMIVRW